VLFQSRKLDSYQRQDVKQLGIA